LNFLDFWKESLGKKIEVTLKDGKVQSGVLKIYDMHTNLLLDNDGTPIFIRGDSVQSVTMK